MEEGLGDIGGRRGWVILEEGLGEMGGGEGWE